MDTGSEVGDPDRGGGETPPGILLPMGKKTALSKKKKLDEERRGGRMSNLRSLKESLGARLDELSPMRMQR